VYKAIIASRKGSCGQYWNSHLSAWLVVRFGTDDTSRDVARRLTQPVVSAEIIGGEIVETGGYPLAGKGQKSTNVNEYQVLYAAQELTQEADIFAVQEDEGEEAPALTPQQWQAIGLLVSGKRQVDIAQELGIAPETLSRWKAQPVFAAALNLALRESYAATLGELRDARAEAVGVLRELMNSDSVDDRIRLAAAKAVLSAGLQVDVSALSLPTTPAEVANDRLAAKRRQELESMF
jgi:hypothetical protein